MSRSKLLVVLLIVLVWIPSFLYTVHFIGKQWEYANTTSAGRFAGVSLRSASDMAKTAGTLATAALAATVSGGLLFLLLKKNRTTGQHTLLKVDAGLFIVLALAYGTNQYLLYKASRPVYYRDYDSTGRLHNPEKFLGQLKARKVILISIDTLAPKHLHCYGNTHETSPNIDRLKTEGVFFTSCFSQSPKTSPAHMTMFTSLYPSVHKIRNWNTNKGGYALDHTVITLPEIMQHAGYATAAFTGGGNVDGSIGFSSGFDLYENNDQLWEKASQWLELNSDKQFFMFLHTFKVHSPYLPPPPYNTLFDSTYQGAIVDSKAGLDEQFQKTGNGGAFPGYHELFWANVNKADPRDVQHLVALYDGGIRFMDEEIFGKLVATLKALNLYDEVLLVFTADHGEEFGEHGDFLHKELYDEHLHVPLIIKFPHGERQGLAVTQQVRIIDLLPTLLTYLGLPVPENAQGTSLLPALDNEQMELNVYAERTETFDVPDKKKAIRTPQWKFILWPTLGTHELYNLASDPGEHQNLLERSPEIRDELQGEIEHWMRVNDDKGRAIRERQNDLDPQTIAKLRSLGYVK